MWSAADTYVRMPMYVCLCTYAYVRMPMYVYLCTYTYVRLYLSTSRYSEQFLWHICKSINRTFRPRGFLQLLHCVYQSRVDRLPTSSLQKSVWRETAASCVHTYTSTTSVTAEEGPRDRIILFIDLYATEIARYRS